MDRVLVTGGAGFIGSHTCLLLLEKGYEIIVLDSLVNSSSISLDRVSELFSKSKTISENHLHFVKGDLRDQKLLEKIFEESKVQCKSIQSVIHFAGLKSVADSVKDPLLYWDVNVYGSINLLRVMNSYACRKIVFSSSATIYGASENYNLDENADIKPINPYGTNKVAIEHLLKDIFKSSSEEWHIRNLRYFNPIGAHPSGLIGEDPLGIPNNIFPFITKVAAGKLKKLNVFGNDWPTADGTGVRDYIHVMDIAEGHIAALQSCEEEKPQCLSINLGTGKGTSVLELIDIFERVNNIKIPYTYTSRRTGDSPKVIADNKLAISLLDWYPKRSIEDMCVDGWHWQLKNPNGYK